MSQFYPTEEVETRKFLKHLLNTPQDLATHIRRYVVLFLDKASHVDKFKEPPAPLSSVFLMVTKSMRQKILSSLLLT